MKMVKFLVAVVLMAIIAQIIHGIGAVMDMSYYKDPNYSSVWSKIMMPNAGPPPASFMFWALGLGLISWALFAIGYMVIKKGIPGKNRVVKGLCFGLIIFILSELSGSFAMFLIFNLPLMLIISWAIEGLVILIINGMITAVMI